MSVRSFFNVRRALLLCLSLGSLAALCFTPKSDGAQQQHAPLTFCTTPSFNAPVPFSVGQTPLGLDTGDFNNDAKRDVAVANFTSHTVSVLLGNGAGSFTLGATLNTGNNPGALVVADFNNDSRADIASANSGSDTVSVFLGNGAGAFGNALTLFVGANPSGIAVGDLNADGRRDIVTANADTDNFTLLTGNGNGTFAAPRNVAAGFTPLNVVVADFNGDSRSDVGIVNFVAESVSLHLAVGPGFFPGPELFTGTAPSDAATADFNGDGRADIVTANTGSFDISVFLRNTGGGPGGGFADPVNYNVGESPSALATGDFNGDNKTDIAVANGDTNDVSLLLGNGNGTFQAAINFLAGASPSGIAAADFDGDGNLDFIVANADTNTVSLLRNTCGAPTPTPGPVLVTETGSDRAIALASVSFRRDPFPLTDSNNLSTDTRARIILFSNNITAADASLLTAKATDAQNNDYALVIEDVRAVPDLPGFTQITARLPATLGAGDNVLVRITLRGVQSNAARVYITP